MVPPSEEWFPRLSGVVVSLETKPAGSVSEGCKKWLLDMSVGLEGARLLSDQELLVDYGTHRGTIRCFDKYERSIFLLTLSSRNVAKSVLTEDSSWYDAEMSRLVSMVPINTSFALRISSGWSPSEEEAYELLTKLEAKSGLSLRSVGVINDVLWATLEDGIRKSRMETSGKRMAVVGLDTSVSHGAKGVLSFLDRIVSMAAVEASIDSRLADRGPMLEQVEASETSTQVRINEIFAAMRRSPEEIKPADLESMLTEVTILFSRLSIVASAMTRDYVKAEAELRSLRSLFNSWCERPVHGRATNSLVELDAYECAVKPLKDFVERVDALRVQLNTILDAVRTYLGVRQQSLTLEEQKSSKEQLVRLVNLQEILHKLEILIVAVYMTEMAKVVFEAFFEGHAGFYTALFIPFALVLSVLIGKLLHRGH